ncbi:Glycogen debranching enzyme [Granulicella sibirica]|uniref:Glycogen debranching enzyme n=1 Tax=Granulicella sibirica TaxID=2479048 RepID=A0A4Q0T1U3_9BACT|nr:Glycogen debranching enzyme [Granulicella sibirica]
MTLTRDGANFSLFSANATGVTILFFDHVDATRSEKSIRLNPVVNRTGHYWHIFVPGVRAGQIYGYRADGPNDPPNGKRFDSSKILLDPYGRAVAVGANYSRGDACRAGDNTSSSMKSVVVDMSLFDWDGDAPLNHSFRNTIVYEMHVAGFTRHPNSGVPKQKRGSYSGVIEKIPYLQNLGITAVEILPVFQFDPQSAPSGLTDYWGYNPVSFFAPHLGYSESGDPVKCIDEFREMVKQLHRAGIEVILDVVYNHTAEAGDGGPTFCFRGLGNSTYYILNQDQAGYFNATGAGNTLKTNHSVVKRMILDSLKFWVSDMHVDGFRFDLASVLTRDVWGQPMSDPPILWDIDSEPVLAGTKLIAEAWDEGGLYQVGSFGHDRWNEWNGQFRDDIRSFLKGDSETVWKLRERISGSYDLYRSGDRPAGQSVNFITCHDGFTLNDLVSYNYKHNEANKELNGDGTNANLSWNCGSEGVSTNTGVNQLRTQQIKNGLVLTLLSTGTPMLLMGDEVRRTQAGNNNAYCQDDLISWFNWDVSTEKNELLRFTQLLVRLRLDCDNGTLQDGKQVGGFVNPNKMEWHGIHLDQPDWSADSHSLAFTWRNESLGEVRYVAINSFWETLEFDLPPVTGGKSSGWLRLVDTSLASPFDIADLGEYVPIQGSTYIVNPRSAIILRYDYAVADSPYLR